MGLTDTADTIKTPKYWKIYFRPLNRNLHNAQTKMEITFISLGLNRCKNMLFGRID